MPKEEQLQFAVKIRLPQDTSVPTSAQPQLHCKTRQDPSRSPLPWSSSFAGRLVCRRGVASASLDDPQAEAGGERVVANSISHHLRNHGKPLFVGIYRGMIVPGILMWCRISSIHSSSGGLCLTKSSWGLGGREGRGREPQKNTYICSALWGLFGRFRPPLPPPSPQIKPEAMLE